MTIHTLKTTTPVRTTTNKDVRVREYLTSDESDQLIAALKKKSRNPNRDALLVTMMFRHGLRVGEAVTLKWDQIDFKDSTIRVNRLKGSKDSVHPIPGPELRLLRKMEREKNSRYIFLSERKSPLTTQAVYRMLRNVEQDLGWDFPIHPHMLRHSCGYYLANQGHDTRAIQMYMGHTSINNTVLYTQLTGDRFKNFWKD
ncbi:MAG: type 1 fimbriae regulatory protein FimE [Chlamydiales bacterium]|jgi:type 1 fimbriae regulatory protein FimE